MPPVPVGALTVGEIAIRVKRAFGDEAGAQITDADIIRWLNDAMRDIAINNDLLQVKATSDAFAGISEYHIPLDMLTLRSAKFRGHLLKPYSIQEANEHIQGHDGEEPRGTPTHYWIWSNTINLFPTPSADATGQLMLYYTRQPIAVTVAGDVPELPAPYHNRLVEYCIAQAYELDDNLDSYRSKMQQFEDGVSKLKGLEDWQIQDTYPTITVSASDYGDGW